MTGFAVSFRCRVGGGANGGDGDDELLLLEEVLLGTDSRLPVK